MEIKNVVITDYHISTAPKDRKVFYTDKKKSLYKRIGVFPDGKVKPGNTIVSPRAFKHLLELEKISKKKINELYLYLFYKDQIVMHLFQIM